MRRLFPFPLLTLGLLGMWLLLNQTVALGHILLGGAVATGAGLAMAALKPQKPKIGKPLAVLRLLGIVATDVIRSNFAVAGIAIQGKRRKQTSGFMTVPIDMQNRYGLAILSIIMTATPGTVWLNFDAGSGRLLIHVLDLKDEQAWIDIIKNRYERLLMEIFQ
ncbi:Na+/H+ antiporter subunit E [Arsenicitalea aurantiaca]|uniref:Na+/H+ antiporter subunit E n=1 Tax=Arsenicitalea aurantiaca TaxID=1783274 RepID=A0A433XF58_9HYPH|nr:Na+/H+ antiporter subunit E [Arsenicitalea aurantiaca]RUT32578.1 Na+/H+ antiporter subunit E [Arsenicitalea aurantiaca]